MYAKWYFYLASPPEGSEVSRYEHYQQAQKSGTYVPQLEAPPLNDLCVIAWRFFASSPEVTYTNILAYTQLTGETFTPFDVDLIVLFDRIRRNPGLWQLPPKN